MSGPNILVSFPIDPGPELEIVYPFALRSFCNCFASSPRIFNFKSRTDNAVVVFAVQGNPVEVLNRCPGKHAFVFTRGYVVATLPLVEPDELAPPNNPKSEKFEVVQVIVFAFASTTQSESADHAVPFHRYI